MTNFKLVKLLNFGIEQEQKRTSLKYEKQTPVDIYFLWYVKIQGQKIFNTIPYKKQTKREKKSTLIQVEVQFQLNFKFNVKKSFKVY